ncbi:MAG: exodeoxyribonuclease VII large subunit [Butyrivibrio sp.]
MAKIYTVEQVNNYIKNMFNTDFVLNKISVKGEVSNCKYHSSGHIYFTIKDKGNTLQAIMFAGNRNGLRFKMEDGMQVIVSGRISVYERDGKYQLYAASIEQAGIGELYERFLKLKNDLEEMGMFDAMFKQPIPKYIRTLGVVTASTGAAIQDIINVSTRRNPYIQIVLYPALVQGEGAALSICNGIKALEEYGVDVIIAGRGGGSIEDLWAFNEEIVARTIFECKVPVISAVGHETDFTIADFVADMRAPTPSAAAELAVADITQVIKRLDDAKARLYRAGMAIIQDYRNRLKLYRTRIEGLSPANTLMIQKKRLSELSEALDRHMKDILLAYRNRLQLICARLEADSPLARLSGGYSYVTDESGQALTSVKETDTGRMLSINMSDGVIDAKVLQIKEMTLYSVNER